MLAALEEDGSHSDAAIHSEAAVQEVDLSRPRATSTTLRHTQASHTLDSHAATVPNALPPTPMGCGIGRLRGALLNSLRAERSKLQRERGLLDDEHNA